MSFVRFIIFIPIFFLFISCKENIVEKDSKTIITEIVPINGGEGDLITIIGQGFTDNIDSISVKIGDINVAVESLNSDKILIKLPLFINECGEMAVQVISNDSVLTTNKPFIINCPIIEQISPRSGDSGDVITINGANFTVNSERILVTIGNNTAKVIAASLSTINVEILNSYSGKFPIKIKIGNKIAISKDSFNINGPYVKSISSSSYTNCEQIIINGSGFSLDPDKNEVIFGYKEAIVASATATQLIVSPPVDYKDIFNVPVFVFVTVDKKTSKSNNDITLSSTAWQSVPSYGEEGRSRGVGFSMNQKGYAGTGNAIKNGYSELKNDFWEFNPSKDSWSQKSNFPGVPRIDAVGFSINGNGYVGLGGDESNVLFNDFWKYDPTMDYWIQMPDFPSTNRVGAIAFTIGDKGYVGAGEGFGSTSDIWEFDPANNEWLKKTTYPGIGTSGMICFVIANKAYIGSGFLTNDFWEYDPTLNEWRQLGDFPTEFIHNSISFEFDGYGVVGTGNINGKRTDRLWKYDSEIDKWLEIPALLGEEREFAVGFSLNTSFILGMGSSNYEIKNDYYKYECE